MNTIKDDGTSQNYPKDNEPHNRGGYVHQNHDFPPRLLIATVLPRLRMCFNLTRCGCYNSRDMLSRLLLSCLLLIAGAAGQVRQQQPFQQVPHGPAADGFRFLYTLPLQQREYRGTVDGFAAALPGFMQRAATVGGFANRDFSKEIAFI